MVGGRVGWYGRGKVRIVGGFSFFRHWEGGQGPVYTLDGLLVYSTGVGVTEREREGGFFLYSPSLSNIRTLPRHIVAFFTKPQDHGKGAHLIRANQKDPSSLTVEILRYASFVPDPSA